MPLSSYRDEFDEAISFAEQAQLAEPGALSMRELPGISSGDEFDEAIASLSAESQESFAIVRPQAPGTEHGFLGEVAAGLGRGALRVAATPAYLADVAGEAVGWEGLERVGEKGAEKVEKFIEESPSLRKSASISGDIRKNPQLWKDLNWYASIVSEGMPTVISMMIPGVGAARGAQALGWGVKGIGAARVAGGLSAAMGLEAGGAAEQARQYEKATGKEIPIGKKLQAVTGTGIVAGALEYTPIFTIFGKAGGRTLVKRILTAMATEGSTEGAQEVVANHFAKAGYDVDKDMAEGIIESVVGGVLIGGGMGGIAGPVRTMQDQLEASTTPENVERISQVIEEGENEALLDKFRKGSVEDLVSLRKSPEGAEYAKELDRVIGEKGIAEERGLIPREEIGPRALPPGQGFDLIPPKPEIRLRPSPEKIKGPTYPEGAEYVAGKKAPEGLEVEYKPVLTVKEKPFKKKENAFRALKSKRLASKGITSETHEVVPVEGGFGIARKPDWQVVKEGGGVAVMAKEATKEEKLKAVSKKVKAETPGMLKESDKVNDVTLGTLVDAAAKDPTKALEHAADATVSKAKLIEGLKNKGLKAMGEAKTKEERAEIKKNLEKTLRGIEEGKKPEEPTYVRIEETEKKPDTSKPQGLYLVGKGKEALIEDLDGTRYEYTFNSKNPLRVEKELTVRHDRFREFKEGPASSGIKALRKLAGVKEFDRLMQLSKKDLLGELGNKYPDIGWGKYYDSYEMLEGYAGKLARDKGYDSIVGDSEEIVALKPQVLRPKAEILAKEPILKKPEEPITKIPELKSTAGMTKEQAEVIQDAIGTHRNYLNRGGETSLVLEEAIGRGVIPGKLAKPILDRIIKLERQNKLGPVGEERTVLVKKIHEQLDDLFYEKPKEPISKTKSRLLANIKSEKGSSELINDLSRLGADAVKRGHTSFKAFSAEMKTVLGDAWAKVKHLIRRAYSDAKRILKDEKGAAGIDVGKSKAEYGKEHPTLTPGAQKLLGELKELKKEHRKPPPLPPEEVGTPEGKGIGTYNDLAAKLRTRTVDRLYPLMYKLDQGLDITDPDAQAYIQGRMDTSAPTVVAYFYQHGKLKWLHNAPYIETKDEGFLPLTEKHGTNEKKVDSYDTETQTLLKDKIGYKPKSIRDIDRYLFWKIATRAEKLMGEDREHLFTKKDIALLKEIGGRDWKDTDLNKKYVAFNKNVLDFAQEIGLIDPAMRKVWEHDEYIPFYRILEDELLGEEFLRVPVKSRKFIDSQIKKLVGGTDKLGDPFENILGNWSHLITESIRNRSRVTAFKYMQKLGYATPSKPPKYIGKPEKEAILSYMENGKRKYFKIHDLELFNALSGANIEKFDGILMKMFGTSKRMLTYGATFGPAFRVANFLRDTLQTAMVNKSFIPVWDSLKGLYKAYTEHPDAIAMMSGGGGFSLGYVRGDDPKAMARHIRKIIRKAHKKRFTLSPLSLLEWWEKVGSASENAARVQLYANWRKKGASHLVSGFKARDVLDFSLSGDAQVTQLMVRTMPFLGARMQGLYKMGRAYGENPGAFLLKGAALAGLSLAWWSGVKDDDRYKELEDWEKWTYRHFWIGDMHFRLPRAFEVDAIFSSSVETIADVLSKNEEGKHIMHFIGQTMRDTFALDVPQLVRPLYEQAKNEIGFTGRPIISESMKRVKPGEQSKPWTSESLQVLGGKLNVSPMRAEALVRGYLATLGMFVLGGMDVVSQWVFDFPTPPKKRVDDYPLIGRFARETPPRHTKYMTRFYKMTREMDVLVGTINHYKKTGDIEKAVELATASRDTLQYKKGVNKIRKRIGLINGRIKMIHYRKDLTPEQKKEKINKLLDYRNKILENAYTVMSKKEIAREVSP